VRDLPRVEPVERDGDLARDVERERRREAREAPRPLELAKAAAARRAPGAEQVVDVAVAELGHEARDAGRLPRVEELEHEERARRRRDLEHAPLQGEAPRRLDDGLHGDDLAVGEAHAGAQRAEGPLAQRAPAVALVAPPAQQVLVDLAPGRPRVPVPHGRHGPRPAHGC